MWWWAQHATQRGMLCERPPMSVQPADFANHFTQIASIPLVGHYYKWTSAEIANAGAHAADFVRDVIPRGSKSILSRHWSFGRECRL